MKKAVFFLIALTKVQILLAANLGAISSNTENVELKCGIAKEFSSRRYYTPNIVEKTHMEMNDLPLCIKSRVNSNDTEEERIVGSSTTINSSASFPWIANLRILSNGRSSHWCGATILSEFFLLTAAHCIENHKISSFTIRVGEYHQHNVEETEEDFYVEDIIVHKDYHEGVAYNNDIALVKIKDNNGKGITFNRYVQPICLPTNSTPYSTDIEAVTGGWGVTESKRASLTLLVTRVPIMDWEHCRTLHGFRGLTEGMMCAGHIEGSSDSCQGDSGGPLIVKMNDRAILFGVVSWGYGCGEKNSPGVYANVKYYIPWILDSMERMCS